MIDRHTEEPTRSEGRMRIRDLDARVGRSGRPVNPRREIWISPKSSSFWFAATLLALQATILGPIWFVRFSPSMKTSCSRSCSAHCADLEPTAAAGRFSTCRRHHVDHFRKPDEERPEDVQR